MDLGTKHAGYIPLRARSALIPLSSRRSVLKVGDEIEVYVVRVNDHGGYLCMLSKKTSGLGLKSLGRC